MAVQRLFLEGSEGGGGMEGWSGVGEWSGGAEGKGLLNVG